MARRRGNKEGSIYFHKASGKWCAQVSLNGRRLTKYFKTQSECRDWLLETRNQINNGLTYSGAKLRIGEYLRKWLENIKPNLKPKTWIQYEQVARDHIVPYLGNIKLNDLRPDQIQNLYSKKIEEGRSPSTVRIIHAVIHRALSMAVQWGLIGRNPAASVQRPKVTRKEMQYLNKEQVKILLKAVENTRFSALYHIAVTAGLRQGELLGLKWSDVDWQNKRIHIQRQVQLIPGRGLVFTELKTDKSRRVIAVGDLTVQKLKRHQEIIAEIKLFAGVRWKETGVIFPSTVGTPLSPRNLYRQFAKMLTDADLPKIRFHDLRHTAATLMFSEGVHPKIVQERLGHSSISMTLDTYSHLIPSMQEDIAKKIDEHLS